MNADLKLNEAIIASGRSRLRPVLMTSLTTILGMLPLAMSTGSGSEIWSPMGIAVIGGLVFLHHCNPDPDTGRVPHDAQEK